MIRCIMCDSPAHATSACPLYPRPPPAIEWSHDPFGVIVGCDAAKEVMTRALNAPAPVHVLLVGPPATAKTLFLECVERARKGQAWYALGSTTRKAGLVRYLADRRPRYLLIDEIEKLDRADFSALLSLMESGRLSETKTGRLIQGRLVCWVFAAANSTERIPSEVMSRFVTVHIPHYTDEELVAVMAKMLEAWDGAPREGAVATAMACIRHGLRDPRDARKVWRMTQPGEDPDGVAALLAGVRGEGVE